jgi:hypothetical protein
MWNRLSHHIVWLAYSVALFVVVIAVWLGTVGPPLTRWGLQSRRMEIWLIAIGSVIAGWLAWELTAQVAPGLLRRADPAQATDYDDAPPAP